jgi:UDP-glucose 4-epimerase
LVRQLDACAIETFVGDLSNISALRRACDGVDTIIHCAGYAHDHGGNHKKVDSLHWKVNYEGTKNLIQAATECAVTQFVFISTVKAAGAPDENCVDETFERLPETAYGCSKLAAEKDVLKFGQVAGKKAVVLRPCMVYGAGARGNLERMARLIRYGLFPPLPETGNRRSLLHVDDLVAAIELVVRSPAACGRVFIVAGAEAPSGRGLQLAISAAMKKKMPDWSFSPALLTRLARFGDGVFWLTGRRFVFNSDVCDRLLKSACYSNGLICRELGWHPVLTLDEGLREMLSC